MKMHWQMAMDITLLILIFGRRNDPLKTFKLYIKKVSKEVLAIDLRKIPRKLVVLKYFLSKGEAFLFG